MLLNNDIIESKQIVFDVTKKSVLIDSIDVFIILNVRSSKTIVQRLIHLRKTIVVSSHAELTISIHNVNLSKNRNFLFESDDDIELNIYVYMINAIITIILIRNDKNVSIKISKNYRFEHVIEIDFFNVFHIEEFENVKHLIIKKFKFIHQIDWFKKFISVCVVVYVVTTTVIFDDVDSIASSIISIIRTNIFINFAVSTIISFTISYKSHNTLQISDASRSSQKQIFSIDLKQSFTNSIISVEIIMLNDVIIYRSKEIDNFVKIIKNFSTFWHDTEFVAMSKDNWMRIFLKFDWENRVSNKIKVYSLKIKNKQLINDTFDEFHRIDKLFWINEFTSFSYSMFCVWKNVDNERKRRVVINIRNFNVITQSNVYFLFLQDDIFTLMRSCQYIFVINCFVFFYQWKIHFIDRHKLIVINHCDQKNFNVAIMKYKNSSTYVQRQIDRLLRKQKKYVRVYVNDIVIFFNIKKKHEVHFRFVFAILKINNIFIKSTKTFLSYFNVFLLKQKIDSLNLIIIEEKLRAIVKLRFFKIFH